MEQIRAEAAKRAALRAAVPAQVRGPRPDPRRPPHPPADAPRTSEDPPAALAPWPPATGSAGSPAGAPLPGGADPPGSGTPTGRGGDPYREPGGLPLGAEHTRPAPRDAAPLPETTATRTVAPPPAQPTTRPRAARRHSIRAQVLAALRTDLIEGGLVPGEVYSAPVLAERFGVSATPVREAMQQLASEGAVETVPNRGFRVAEYSARDAQELAEVRALLEVPALLRLAHTLPAEGWSRLRPLAEATLTAANGGDRAGYAEADRAFHRALLELTGNRHLVATTEDLHRRAQCARARTRVYLTADLRSEAEQHLLLLESLGRRDLALAERVIREHFAGA